ncbi:unnamed protein product, partial [Penicillium discolor]
MPVREVEPPEQPRIAAHPEGRGRMRSEVVETGRPSLVAGDDERRSEPRGLPEMERRVEVVDARAPPVERIAEAALRDTVEVARRAGGERHGVRRPDGRDEPARVGVPGLRDPRP